jgi:mono/diheme cytochrome c family protein
MRLVLCEKIGFVMLRMKIVTTGILMASLFAAQPAHALFGGKTKAAEKAGAILFRDKGCAHCHGVGGIGGKKAPSLVGIRADQKWTPAKITDQILNGGQKMPAFNESVTDAEAAQLVAYLRAKHRPVPALAEAPAT